MNKPQIQKKLNLPNNPLDTSNVGWNSSNLFYIFLNELDMDYRDSYYMDDWNKMYKVFKLKYMKVNSFILSKASKVEREFLENDDIIRDELIKLKGDSTDFANKWNSGVVTKILTIIEKKMILIDQLMSKAGMNILLQQIEKYRPAALGNDDFTWD